MKSSNHHARFLRFLLLLAIATTTCAQDQSKLPRGHYPPNTEQKTDTKFIRFIDKGKGEGSLETAIVTYEGKKGEVVELISAVHVADIGYYERMNKLFASYDSLLYELIKRKGARPPKPGRKRRSESGNMLGWFQRFLRDSLDLDFQLDAIDYRAKNFVHADLDAETFQKLNKERGESIVQLMLKLALAEYKRDKEGKSKSDPNLGLKMIAALFMPDSARALKYLLAAQLQNMEELLAGLKEGADGKGSVLLIERNKKLMRVLRDRLKMGEKNIGVFYGGAHLSDVEERIFKEIGLKRTKIRWEKAWVIARPKGGRKKGGGRKKTDAPKKKAK